MKEIYIPEIPSKERKYTELTAQEALAQGFRFRRKRSGRVRITKYTGENMDITIPAVIGGGIVNEIGKKAFADSGISRVDIPETVRKIGERAFSGCKKLKFVDIPWDCSIADLAFYNSGLRGFAHRTHTRNVDGSAFAVTPMKERYSAIVYDTDSLDGGTFDHEVIAVLSSDADFSGSVRFGRNAFWHAVSADLSACTKIEFHDEAFECTRSSSGAICAWCGRTVIFPENWRSSYIPWIVDGKYPDGRKYANIYEKRENDGLTEITVHGGHMPMYSLNVQKCDIALEPRRIHFSEKAVSGLLTSFRAGELYGEGCPFSGCCYLHKVETNGFCVYLPTAEHGFSYSAHAELLKAFRGRTEGGAYSFFDDLVFDRVFTQPIDSYSDFDKRGHDHPDTPPKAHLRLSKKRKIMLAVDVLRSTGAVFRNRQMYADYLLKNRRYAMKLTEKLPEGFLEYALFLEEFYA